MNPRPLRTLTLLPVLMALHLSSQDPLRICCLTPRGGGNSKGSVCVVDAVGGNFTNAFPFTYASG